MTFSNPTASLSLFGSGSTAITASAIDTQGIPSHQTMGLPSKFTVHHGAGFFTGDG